MEVALKNITEALDQIIEKERIILSQCERLQNGCASYHEQIMDVIKDSPCLASTTFAEYCAAFDLVEYGLHREAVKSRKVHIILKHTEVASKNMHDKIEKLFPMCKLSHTLVNIREQCNEICTTLYGTADLSIAKALIENVAEGDKKYISKTRRYIEQLRTLKDNDETYGQEKK